MLTGKMVRVRFYRERVMPAYLDTNDEDWLETAERMLMLFRGPTGRPRGELEDDVDETFGTESRHLIYQGLAKLLFDRCEFETVSGLPPDQLRDMVFAAATEHRKDVASAEDRRVVFDRNAVLTKVAAELETTVEAIEHGLFADLKSEQRLIKFKDTTARRLLKRYNVALVQAVLLRSTRVQVTIRNETPQRYRQLLRLVKFHRLVCDVKKLGAKSISLTLDGPLSLFSATNKYGIQLAFFFPSVLLCKDFELHAELRWGPQRKHKILTVTPRDGLVTHAPDYGTYVPDELRMFVELFKKKVEDWDIREETEIYPLGDGFWVPDFRLTHKKTKKAVLLEVLGFWRRSSAEKHLERLRKHAEAPFVLAVSDSLHIEDAELEALPAGIHRFRQMPLPDEVVKVAAGLVGVGDSEKDQKD